MNSCKTCKWWGERGEAVRYNSVGLNVKFCDNPQLVNIDEEGGYDKVPDDGFGLDYPVCDLVTGPEFGCTKWEGE